MHQNLGDEFYDAMKAPIKELQGFVNTNEYTITSENDLIEFKLNGEIELLSTGMRKLEIKVYGEYNLLNQWVEVGYGVKLEDESYKYLTFGEFLVVEQTYIKDEDTTSYIAYDRMILFMKSYEPLEVQYPISLFDYLDALCNKVGVPLGNWGLEYNNNYTINEELWENINGITYRDVLQQIAQTAGGMAFINEFGNLEIISCWTGEVSDTLTYDDIITLKTEEPFGPVNSIVLARTPQEDNIYKQDEESIVDNGLCEIRIENNEIMDKNRDDAIIDVYNSLNDITYCPFECTTSGLGYFELTDKIHIVNNDNEEILVPIHYIDITFDGGIKEVIKGVIPSATQTQYQYASPVSKRLKNTEIIVNKQEQYIEQLVTDMYEENGIVNENFTQVHQDIDNIINAVQASGGVNLIKNSVMFAYDANNNPTDWTVSGNGTINITTSSESLLNGCLSGNMFILNDKTVKQRVQVKISTDDNKNYYSFSTKIKKDLSGTCYVKLYNNIDEYIINVAEGENPYFIEFKIDGILAHNNYLDVEFYGSTGSNASFTDNILCLGQNALNWQQAAGELMNTQVNINKDGLLVKSSIYVGDYTVMSPLEFAGYSNVNGTLTKIFSLNKDTTITKKLKSEDEITMYPIKIVPITTGNTQGWAFVPIVDEEVE